MVKHAGPELLPTTESLGLPKQEHKQRRQELISQAAAVLQEDQAEKHKEEEARRSAAAAASSSNGGAEITREQAIEILQRRPGKSLEDITNMRTGDKVLLDDGSCATIMQGAGNTGLPDPDRDSDPEMGEWSEGDDDEGPWKVQGAGKVKGKKHEHGAPVRSGISKNNDNAQKIKEGVQARALQRKNDKDLLKGTPAMAMVQGGIRELGGTSTPQPGPQIPGLG